MSSFNIDPRGVLVDALKQNAENFEESNLILPSKNSLRAVFELKSMRADMMEFAKNPEIGVQMLGKPPVKPNLDNLSDDEADQREYEYMEMQKMYEHEKLALTMHIPYADLIMIDNYLSKFRSTLNATAAVKGKRFYAFTKNVEEQEGGFFDFLKRGNQQ